MIFDQRFLRYFLREEKTVNFVCNECKIANATDSYERHCQRHDTWCDCRCRNLKGPNGSSRRVEELSE